MIKKIKNNTATNQTWCGQEIEPAAYYEIQSQEELSWANDSALLVAIATAEALVNNGTGDIADVNTAIDYLKDNLPKDVIVSQPAEVIPMTIKNDHCMQPFGAHKGYFESKGAVSGDYICPITLSNKSVDGLTFTYNSNIPIVPAVGNYVFQDNLTKRSWITSIDTVNHTATFELPVLEEGAGVYSKGYYVDCKVVDWASAMYLWGLTINIIEYEGTTLVTEKNELFIELSIVDMDDMFKTDQVCQALFGVDAVDAEPYLTAMGFEINREYGTHFTKYYDESWAMNCNNKYTGSPDGAPGELLPGLYARFSCFATEDETCKFHIYLDYYFTSKS